MGNIADEGKKLSVLLDPSCQDNEFDEDDELYMYACQIQNFISLPMALRTAYELGLLETISKAGRPLSAAEIATQLDAKNPNAAVILDQLLHLMATFSVLNCTVEEGGDGQRKLYGLAPRAKFLVSNEDGASMAPTLALVYDHYYVNSWYKLKDAIFCGGIPFDLANKASVFEVAGMDQRFNNLFNISMLQGSAILMKKIMQSYKGFENVKQLVDVGGGTGETLKAIVAKYPSMKGINFDLPHVIQNALCCPGVENIGGDMFETIPSGDAIHMKWILHSWTDDQCIKLLKNCYKVLPDNGKVIVIDAIKPEMPETNPLAKMVTLSDVMMTSWHPGGKERTLKELQYLANAAGFTTFKLVQRAYETWIMEFYK
ncbi:hypothetical protein Ancab_040100 [Ancistrocladus abbreviatus]